MGYFGVSYTVILAYLAFQVSIFEGFLTPGRFYELRASVVLYWFVVKNPKPSTAHGCRLYLVIQPQTL